MSCFLVAEASKLRIFAHEVGSFLLCIFASNLRSTLVKTYFAMSSPSHALLNLCADPACVLVWRNCSLSNTEKGKTDAMSHHVLAAGSLRQVAFGSGPSGDPRWVTCSMKSGGGEGETRLSCIITDVNFPERLSIPVQAESERPQMPPVPARGKPCPRLFQRVSTPNTRFQCVVGWEGGIFWCR